VIRSGPQADLEARARAGLARADYALGRIGADTAVSRLKRIARGLPGSRAAIEARYEAARILAEAGAGGRALEQLRHVVEKGGPQVRERAQPLIARLLPAEMARARERGAPLEAFGLYSRYAGERPAVEVHQQAFRALMDLQALQAARRLIAKERQVRGESVRLRRWEWRLAREYRRARLPEGVEWVDEVLARDPDHPWSARLHVAQLRLLSELGRHGEVLERLSEQTGLPPGETVALRARAHKARGELERAFRLLDEYVRGAENGTLPGPLLGEAGDLAALTGKVYRARDYWVRALEAGVAPWERVQLQALLGVDAVQREDFSEARAYFAGLPEDGVFGQAAAVYSALTPLMRDHLRGQLP
jgi:hypothetical protein